MLLLLGAVVLGGLLFWGVVVTVWVYFFGKEFAHDTQAILEDGNAAGRTLDAEGCLNTALTLMDACKFYDFRCRFRQQFFLQGCLQSSRAHREYCEKVPPATQLIEGYQFRTEECTKRNQAKSQGCAQLLQTVQIFCQTVREESGAQ